jgi:hypothetical protein
MTQRRMVVIGDATPEEFARALAHLTTSQHSPKIDTVLLSHFGLAEEAVAEMAGFRSVAAMYSSLPHDDSHEAVREQHAQAATKLLLERMADAVAIVIREADWDTLVGDELLTRRVFDLLIEQNRSLVVYMLHAGWTELQGPGFAYSV